MEEEPEEEGAEDQAANVQWGVYLVEDVKAVAMGVEDKPVAKAKTQPRKKVTILKEA